MCGATDRPIDMHKIDVKCIINDVKEIGVNEELDVMQKSDEKVMLQQKEDKCQKGILRF